jgi:adenosylmethionine-8-amino-7-oxononanoate aminotransferase
MGKVTVEEKPLHPKPVTCSADGRRRMSNGNDVQRQNKHNRPVASDTLAAVIGELISVSNNNHVPSRKYWQRVHEICDKRGVFLILDKVINGFGRAGTMCATEQPGVVPDLITMVKGLSSGDAPIAAVAVGEHVYDEFKKQDIALAHLLTFGGQAVSGAAALKNIEILQRGELARRSARNGTYLLELLQSLRPHPTVGDVRGLGLKCAVELVQNTTSKEPFGWGPAASSHPYSRRGGSDGGALSSDARLHVGPALPTAGDRQRGDRPYGHHRRREPDGGRAGAWLRLAKLAMRLPR